MSKIKFIADCVYWVAYAVKELSYAAGEFINEVQKNERKKAKKEKLK